MKATQILMEEHRVIERLLAALEIGARRVADGGTVEPRFFTEATQVVKGFADGCHHHKEEGVLFQTMVEQGLPLHTGPVAMMLSEHEQGRVYTRGLREAAELMAQGDPQARRAVVSNALGYVSLLREHIAKEDNILFPMADEVIPVALHDTVIDGFEHVEHEETGEGVHEKYLGMVNALEREMQD